MKTGKYISLGDYKNVKLGYGTVDHKNLKTIYVKLNSWLEPGDNSENEFINIISKTKRKIKLRLYNLSSHFFKKECIVDLDIKTGGIKPKKKSFMNIELTLFMDKKLDFRDKELKPLVEKIIKDIVDYDLDNEILFNFNKK